MSELRSRDILRHRRHSQQQVYDFPVKGNSDPFILGLYYIKVLLGSPPKEFYVQIDTGSDDLWVSCTSCIGCPQMSLQIDLNYFDPASSSTSALVSCLDQRCHHDLPTLDGYCDSENRCAYTFHYGDGSVTSGYYISDVMHFANISEGSTTNSSTPLVFGCSNLLTGAWTTSLNAIDGIFGLGQHGMSIISQLPSQGIAPRVFSHCLKGDIIGGGILVLGAIVEPDIIYTPLVPSQPHYNLDLQSISVNGHMLQIDPAVFATSSKSGTFIDSGTTLAYLPEEAYDTFVNAIAAAVPQSIQCSLQRRWVT